MATQARKHSLTHSQRRLLHLMQTLNFGCINNLIFRDGQLVLDPPPEVFREVKFGGENGPRPEAVIEDFLLKSQVVEFFDRLDRLGDGVIESLEIKHGLPFRMTVRETFRP
jgi:hypothetical protein